ncbi:MAG: hypothetical protein P4L31_04435 [Candidatus Babeliales bacterium]|nr:hypothetical protein [Candidatus Babeliales bacterium]
MISHRFFYFLLLTYGILAETNCVAVFYKLEEWEDIYSGQIIIGLSDIHFRCLTSTKFDEQQKDLLRIAKILNAFVIVEDAASYAGNNEIIKKSIPRIGFSPLHYLAKLCQKNNIQNYNVEFRFAHATIKNILSDNLCKHDEMHSYLVNEANDAINEITNYPYNDNIACVYKNMNTILNNSIQEIVNKNAGIDNFYRQFSDKDNMTTYEDYEITLFTGDILNAKIFHQLYLHRDDKVIIIAAGGAHIRLVMSMLERLGYYKKNNMYGKEFQNLDLIREPYYFIREIDTIDLFPFFNKRNDKLYISNADYNSSELQKKNKSLFERLCSLCW